MNQYSEEYHDIIEELKPMINEPEFNKVLDQVASAILKQKRFFVENGIDTPSLSLYPFNRLTQFSRKQL